ncbi:hypothetical protein SERLA73DRAFT_177265 [Serpula lacrymans var. lacrymans S7.3]|uniref:Transcription factor IIIC subunit 5 HTH domain-containing protein n=2 Tax=Serpula lacrymans var. lacrymans TaxID=341189 RepID=F8PNP4_SERL3|nr:uncharacterized protein SERLADRAFT_460774 [Serpula lacrymans var. lacrymans S7.9]EGO01771.1 hypothetical protein SERLA73DRAFT_177265 [Serpula lacrymans var. lacrymans S7.3]EGO27407.1 hypothetical protein SERLADRAFT_460774 [Serpula lacrymans var. lacrymans S7.9]
MESSSNASTSSSEAPERPLPSTPFYSVEYPGYVQSSSVPLAIRSLGGQINLDSAFKRTASKHDALLELNLRPGNPFAHPIPGDVVGTNNIVLKIIKRKRRRLNDGDQPIGEYTAEAIGVIPKTARFRSMADYQYQPDMNDPLSQLRLAMDRMDVDAIRNYRIPDEKEDYIIHQHDVSPNLDPALAEQSRQQAPSQSNLRLFPPPVFSRQGIPQNYNFKANPASMVTTVVDDETGEEKKRLINKSRWRGYGPATIMFVDQAIPDGPPSSVLAARDQMDQSILKSLQELFAERPIWTRMSLFNHFTPQEAREIHNSKALLPLVCYVFQDGPWRDTLVRFNYDPRKTVDARFYQRLYFRNANHPIARPSVVSRRQETRSNPGFQSYSVEQVEALEAERRKSHIFDGVTLTKETAAFQLCDIHDPMLKGMIEDDDDLREVCDERDGWYSAHAFERIKMVLRHKFFSLLEGYVVTDEECIALLGQEPGASKPTSIHAKKLRAGKHNMAKGALRPEDAAAARLRATLERNAKNLQATRRGEISGSNMHTSDSRQ